MNIPQKFNVNYHYPVYFVDALFDSGQNHFQNIFHDCNIQTTEKFLIVIDSNVASSHPTLISGIESFFQENNYTLAGIPLVIQGGEAAKNDFSIVQKILEAINNYGIDRHSYIIAIGGGAVLDVAGFAAAIGHRGIRHIRIPTTVLSQNDSGVGVKNGINYFGKKNFIGTFAPPFLVINDYSFLKTLPDRDFRSGISEAIKVGLVKDADFFEYININAEKLNARDDEVTRRLIYRCAELHLQHIASGDPFEQGNSRPLDYGHWSAHKLEQLSSNNILHGEAVIIGMCLDAVYANFAGLLHKSEMIKLLDLVNKLHFKTYVPEMELSDHARNNLMLAGLQEFREHLGGQLTIMLLKQAGKGIEVHDIDESLMLKAVSVLKQNELSR